MQIRLTISMLYSLSLLAIGPNIQATEAYIDAIPDFTQTNIKGLNHGNGQMYCAPVAVSNSLAWLSNRTSQQEDMVKKLASQKYMNTSLKNGTGTTGVLKGISRISIELFGGYSYLQYQGWRKHPDIYSQGVKTPQLSWIKNGIGKQSATWLNIGWYKYNGNLNEYKRIGGHWVTLVGFTDKELIIHDPSPRAGKKFSNEYVKIKKINSGKLTGNKSGLPRNAKGYYTLEKGMHLPKKADKGIIDGVVRFSI